MSGAALRCAKPHDACVHFYRVYCCAVLLTLTRSALLMILRTSLVCVRVACFPVCCKWQPASSVRRFNRRDRLPHPPSASVSGVLGAQNNALLQRCCCVAPGRRHGRQKARGVAVSRRRRRRRPQQARARRGGPRRCAAARWRRRCAAPGGACAAHVHARGGVPRRLGRCRCGGVQCRFGRAAAACQAGEGVPLPVGLIPGHRSGVPGARPECAGRCAHLRRQDGGGAVRVRHGAEVRSSREAQPPRRNVLPCAAALRWRRNTRLRTSRTTVLLHAQRLRASLTCLRWRVPQGRAARHLHLAAQGAVEPEVPRVYRRVRRRGPAHRRRHHQRECDLPGAQQPCDGCPNGN